VPIADVTGFWLAAGVAGWVAAGVFVTLILGRAAAIGDLLEDVDRRQGPEDRRSASRAWSGQSPGRRRADVLKRELAEAQQALREAQARLERAESHHAS
jgi:hypothetical protein